jgi:hypothetical protein
MGLLAQQTVSLIHDEPIESNGPKTWINYLVLRRLIPIGVLSAALGVALNARSIWEYAVTGHVTAHWIYVLTGGFLVTLGVELVSFGVMARVLEILTAQKLFTQHSSMDRR